MESLTKSTLNNYNISFKQYTHIIEILYNYDKNLRNRYFDNNKYSTLCKNLLNISGYINILKNKQLSLIKVESKSTANYRFFFINKIKERISNNHKNLIITNIIPIITQFDDIKLKLDCQLFENEEMPLDSYLKQINKLKELKYVNEVTYKQINEYIEQTNITKKYDNIICKINEFFIEYYFNIFTLTKLPNILFIITQSLKQLSVGGNLYIFFKITLVNKTITKIFNLLHNSFKK